MRVRYTQRARKAQERIIGALALDNMDAAIRLLARFDHTIALLGQFPYWGHEGQQSGTREWLMAKTSYILVYRVRAGTVEITDIRHSARKQ